MGTIQMLLCNRYIFTDASLFFGKSAILNITQGRNKI